MSNPSRTILTISSLPGALGMYALAAGVQRIDETLPLPVYALLSGSNAATVGLIALAAVQLAEKTIKDRISRLLIIASACAGMCYSALWYYPVLIAIGGLITMIWDGFLSHLILRVKLRLKRRNRESHDQHIDTESVPLENRAQMPSSRESAARPRKQVQLPQTQPSPPGSPEASQEESSTHHGIRPRTGLAVVAVFFGRFYVSPAGETCYRSSRIQHPLQSSWLYVAPWIPRPYHWISSRTCTLPVRSYSAVDL